MNRKRYEHKMMNLIKKIRDDGVENKRTDQPVQLGKAFQHLRKADMRNALAEYGSYKNIWNSQELTNLRKIYNLD